MTPSFSTRAGATYAYTPSNQRLYKNINGDEELTFWGVNGQKLVSYELVVSGSDLRAQNARIFKYFGGRLIYDSGNGTYYNWVYTDRLGSTVKTYPFGQERPSATSNDEQKFGTYYRDAESGLDYAMNRYHASGTGRFLSPDPYMASENRENRDRENRGKPGKTGTENRDRRAFLRFKGRRGGLN